MTVSDEIIDFLGLCLRNDIEDEHTLTYTQIIVILTSFKELYSKSLEYIEELEEDKFEYKNVLLIVALYAAIIFETADNIYDNRKDLLSFVKRVCKQLDEKDAITFFRKVGAQHCHAEYYTIYKQNTINSIEEVCSLIDIAYSGRNIKDSLDNVYNLFVVEQRRDFITTAAYYMCKSLLCLTAKENRLNKELTECVAKFM